MAEHVHHGECCKRERNVWDHTRHAEWIAAAKEFERATGKKAAPPTLSDLDAGDLTVREATR